jgi:hypothetical protein
VQRLHRTRNPKTEFTREGPPPGRIHLSVFFAALKGRSSTGASLIFSGHNVVFPPVYNATVETYARVVQQISSRLSAENWWKNGPFRAVKRVI